MLGNPLPGTDEAGVCIGSCDVVEDCPRALHKAVAGDEVLKLGVGWHGLCGDGDVAMRGINDIVYCPDGVTKWLMTIQQKAMAMTRIKYVDTEAIWL